MKRRAHIFLYLLLCIMGASSCKKLVQDEKRDLLVQAMVSGRWHVETFQEGSVVVTDQFTGYNFQFYENGTVSGLKDTLVEQGIWSSDIQNYSISSMFPEAGDPLKKLNGTWRITDTRSDYVVAEMNTTQGKNILHLRKNP